MSNKQTSRRLGIALFVLIIVGFTATVAYRSGHGAYDARALMTVTSSGGLCAGSCNHPVYNLYDNGTFDGHTRLSGAEVAQLQRIIDTTDFTRYGPKALAFCESFTDGTDRVLLFPQKYGDKTFTPCMLDIPEDDAAFSYIDELLISHRP